MAHWLCREFLVLLLAGWGSAVTEEAHSTDAVMPGRLIRRVRSTGTECPKRFSDIDPNHTMCLKDIGIDIPISDADKQAVVDQMNTHRSGVSPTAKNMQKVVWDENIAAVASKWSRQCVVGHESTYNRRSVPSLPRVNIGQNAGGGYKSIFDCIKKGWYDEVYDFEYGKGSKNGKAVGHYTQVVNAGVSRFGCGIANCSNVPQSYGIYYICDYARLQYGTEVSKPYAEGESCAACPKNCNNRLCDCKGKFCVNGGRLDLTTCNCTCWNLYKGDSCEIVDCPAKDPDYCKAETTAYCTKWANSISNCPYLCGECPVTPTCTLQCQNGGILDEIACKCSCPPRRLGDSCEIVEPCTLQCQHGGTLDKTVCKCSCPPGLSGDSCQIANCDMNDNMACILALYHPGFAYFKRCELCPHICGYCEADCTVRDKEFCNIYVLADRSVCVYPVIRNKACPRNCGTCHIPLP